VLSLPGEAGKTYRHKLGMGKPLGMGAVNITPRLYLTDRTSRYTRLFEGKTWHKASHEVDADPYLEAFEAFILKERGVAPDKEHLAEVERIQHLLAMLEWHEGDSAWQDATRYLEIEREDPSAKGGKVNEYKERPVLPDPLWAGWTSMKGGEVVRSPGRARDRQADAAAGGEMVQSSERRRHGTVKWFNQQKGFGVIVQEDGTELFVHHTNILGSGYKTLREGQRVTYVEGVGRKGRPEAQEVLPQ
jgi:cold shock CspA family protein